MGDQKEKDEESIRAFIWWVVAYFECHIKANLYIKK